MRVIRRFIGDGVSAQIFLRRNAGVVPGKRSSARARFTLAQGEILRLLYGRPAERCCPQTYRKVRQSYVSTLNLKLTISSRISISGSGLCPLMFRQATKEPPRRARVAAG